MSPPLLGWYGDDFTGATDTLSTLARRGLRALLFIGQPTPDRLASAGPLDAVGIAGAARSMAPLPMAQELAPIGPFFRDLGVRVLHYKCCSTFDSAPEVGSIGVAVRTLRADFPNPLVPIFGGQPDLGRYCLFSTLFAAAGSGGEVHRLDRHPTMRAHPVTPMLEADLRRHLAAQGLLVAALHHTAYPAGAAPLQDRLAAIARSGSADAVLLDVGRDEDLALLGSLAWRMAAQAPLLAVGPSSAAGALADSWPGRDAAPAPGQDAPLGPAQGPVLVMVGSLSPVTRAQLAASGSYRRFGCDPARLAADGGYARSLRDEVAATLSAGHHAMMATETPGGGALPAAQAAGATAGFLAELMAAAPVRRLGIAGGDTSSLGARALDLWGLSHRAAPWPGVTICRGHSDDPALDGLEIMLKGGQMGPPDLFERFAA